MGEEGTGLADCGVALGRAFSLCVTAAGAACGVGVGGDQGIGGCFSAAHDAFGECRAVDCQREGPADARVV